MQSAVQSAMFVNETYTLLGDDEHCVQTGAAAQLHPRLQANRHIKHTAERQST